MLRSPVATKLTLALMAAAALLACVAVVSFVKNGTLQAEDLHTPAPKFRIAWQKNLGRLTWLSFSPSGDAFCAITADGNFHVYSSDGVGLYKVPSNGATAAVVADGGRFAMLYTERDPSQPVLTFLDSSGRVYWNVRTVGAVWSGDAVTNGANSVFAVGTGSRYVYIIELGRNRKRFRRWRAPGVVTSVAFDSGGRTLTFTTWQESAIVKTTMRGRQIWRIERNPGLIHRIDSPGLSSGVLTLAMPNRLRADGEFAIFDSAGNQVTRGPINWREKTKVLAAPNGRYLCLSQVKSIEHKGKSVREKHAVLLDATGRVLADKGSLFFAVEPLLVTDQGAVLLVGGKNVLFTMTSSGKLEAAAKAPGLVRRCLRSRDGTRALVECAGGRLLMLTSRQGGVKEDRSALVGFGSF